MTTVVLGMGISWWWKQYVRMYNIHLFSTIYTIYIDICCDVVSCACDQNNKNDIQTTTKNYKNMIWLGVANVGKVAFEHARVMLRQTTIYIYRRCSIGYWLTSTTCNFIPVVFGMASSLQLHYQYCDDNVYICVRLCFTISVALYMLVKNTMT